MRGEAEAVCRNPQVRVEFDKGQEIELRRHDGTVERLLISQWDAVHAEALYEAFPPGSNTPRWRDSAPTVSPAPGRAAPSVAGAQRKPPRGPGSAADRFKGWSRASRP